jgi:glycosyltransferase involved in cell wall biosynthesis
MTGKHSAPEPLVAVVIPTCNRAQHLNAILADLFVQYLQPKLIVIVDSSDSLNIEIQERNSDSLVYIHTKYKSAAYQRNIGLREVMQRNTQISYLAFLDDDVVIDESYLIGLVSTLALEPSLAGVSGIVLELDPSNQKDLQAKQVYFKRQKRGGTIDKFVVNHPVKQSSKLQYANWLMGCAVWRMQDIVRAGSWFESDFMRQSLFEDVIFSHKLSHHYKLAVDSNIRFQHLLASAERPISLVHSSDWVLHRFRLVKLDKCFGYLGYLSSICLMIIKSLLKIFTKHGAPREFSAKGLLIGIKRLCSAR